uniref:EGF-like domain-containing protein n=1 Tax=Chromera velia CCMP2878 TaxID=1169474 RepID=A0A0G4HLG7_9ALVE|eukprot:Cvel_7366.t1-p1 / transcript=Cvel_7366.t1 / gene=Cvel_7366 / organism=Chromera_velia_CCMP2878 / gene_product=Serine-rich adhesin for platelets, putative / transcript_product=Serine-rich adhesin for platelets, putative / location=Cvel_scaffold383:5223-43288(+) / protein_length=4268 / sequence_SO=supercontig / SO=protein_coding / is_pseudo=false
MIQGLSSCASGTSGTIGTVTCPSSFTAPGNGTLTYSPTTRLYPATATFQCNSGYELAAAAGAPYTLSGSSLTDTCTAVGSTPSWPYAGFEPSCTAITCSAPAASLGNGTLSYSNALTYPTTVTWGSVTQSCPTVTTPQNGTVSLASDWGVGSLVFPVTGTVGCEDGFQIVAASGTSYSITTSNRANGEVIEACAATGVVTSWEIASRPPTCSGYSCSTTSLSLSNGVLSYYERLSGTSYTSSATSCQYPCVATFQCNDGFLISNSGSTGTTVNNYTVTLDCTAASAASVSPLSPFLPNCLRIGQTSFPSHSLSCTAIDCPASFTTLTNGLISYSPSWTASWDPTNARQVTFESAQGPGHGGITGVWELCGSEMSCNWGYEISVPNNAPYNVTSGDDTFTDTCIAGPGYTQWPNVTGYEPTCIAAACPSLSSSVPSNGALAVSSANSCGSTYTCNYPATAVFSCNGGYNMTAGGGETIVNNTHTASCGAGGCNDGYALTAAVGASYSIADPAGSHDDTCTPGAVGVVAWPLVDAGTVPTCAAVTCSSSLSAPGNGTITYSPSTREYPAVAGRSVGRITDTCTTTGAITASFSAAGTEPSCTAHTCNDLGTLGNGTITYLSETQGAGSRMFPANATFQCNDGYQLTAPSGAPYSLAGLTSYTDACQLVSNSPVWTTETYTPTCTDGYNLTAPSSASWSPTSSFTYTDTCVGSGTNTSWVTETEVPTCPGSECTQIASFTNGIVTYTSTTGGTGSTVYPAVANVTCDLGYELTPSVGASWSRDNTTNTYQDTCTPTGSGPAVSFLLTTTGNTPQSCQVLECPDLGNLTGGSIAYNSISVSPGTGSRLFPATATYSCNTGYTLTAGSYPASVSSGSFTDSCSATLNVLTWAAASGPPTCEGETCPSLSAPTYGQVAFYSSAVTGGGSSSMKFPVTATYTCNDGRLCGRGFEMIGNSSGTYNVTNNTLTDSCAAALVSGNLSLSWPTATAPPTCEPVDCPSLSAPTNGTVNVTSTAGGVGSYTFPATAAYACNDGYNMTSSSVSITSNTYTGTCQATGTATSWSGGTMPVSCGALDCPTTISAPTNGLLTFTSTGSSSNTMTYPSFATYTCNIGYTLTAHGSASYTVTNGTTLMDTCAASGTSLSWPAMSTQPTCELSACAALDYFPATSVPLTDSNGNTAIVRTTTDSDLTGVTGSTKEVAFACNTPGWGSITSPNTTQYICTALAVASSEWRVDSSVNATLPSCSGPSANGGWVDVDECSTSIHDCATFATCTNSVGSFTCSCNTGLTGNGTHCSGLDSGQTVSDVATGDPVTYTLTGSNLTASDQLLVLLGSFTDDVGTTTTISCGTSDTTLVTSTSSTTGDITWARHYLGTPGAVSSSSASWGSTYNASINAPTDGTWRLCFCPAALDCSVTENYKYEISSFESRGPEWDDEENARPGSSLSVRVTGRDLDSTKNKISIVDSTVVCGGTGTTAATSHADVTGTAVVASSGPDPGITAYTGVTTSDISITVAGSGLRDINRIIFLDDASNCGDSVDQSSAVSMSAGTPSVATGATSQTFSSIRIIKSGTYKVCWWVGTTSSLVVAQEYLFDAQFGTITMTGPDFEQTFSGVLARTFQIDVRGASLTADARLLIIGAEDTCGVNSMSAAVNYLDTSPVVRTSYTSLLFSNTLIQDSGFYKICYAGSSSAATPGGYTHEIGALTLVSYRQYRNSDLLGLSFEGPLSRPCIASQASSATTVIASFPGIQSVDLTYFTTTTIGITSTELENYRNSFFFLNVTGEDSLESWKQVSVDPSGSVPFVYPAACHRLEIALTSLASSIQTAVSSAGVMESQLMLLIDAHRVVLTDWSTSAVYSFFGTSSALTGTAGMSDPLAIASTDSYVFVADSGNHRVLCLQASDLSVYVGQFGIDGQSDSGTPPVGLNAPTDLALTGVLSSPIAGTSSAGVLVEFVRLLYVADYGNHRLIALGVTSTGGLHYHTHFGVSGSPRTGITGLSNPRSVAVSGRLVIVGEYASSRLVFLDAGEDRMSLEYYASYTVAVNTNCRGILVMDSVSSARRRLLLQGIEEPSTSPDLFQTEEERMEKRRRLTTLSGFTQVLGQSLFIFHEYEAYGLSYYTTGLLLKDAIGSPALTSISTANSTLFTPGGTITSISTTNGGSRTDVWTVSPDLPNGISLDSASGVISGTPTEIQIEFGVSCSDGYYWNTGSSACVACPLGTYRAQTSTTLDSCTSCSTGQTTSSTGAVTSASCECVKGYTLELDSTSNVWTCTPCGSGLYKEAAGDTPCSGRCMTNGQTAGGAISLRQCSCMQNYYLKSGPDYTEFWVGASCEACPTGAVCAGGFSNDTLAKLEADGDYVEISAADHMLPEPIEGYYRLGENATDMVFDINNAAIWPCYVQRACLAGADNLCHSNNDGPLCDECMPGFTRVSANNVCAVCPAGIWNLLLVLSIIVISFFIVVFYAQLTLQAGTNKKAMHAIVLKIGVNYVALLSTLSTFDYSTLDWPDWTTGLLSSFTDASAGDPFSLPAFDCLFRSEQNPVPFTQAFHYTKLFIFLMPIAWPLTLTALMALVIVVYRRMVRVRLEETRQMLERLRELGPLYGPLHRRLLEEKREERFLGIWAVFSLRGERLIVQARRFMSDTIPVYIVTLFLMQNSVTTHMVQLIQCDYINKERRLRYAVSQTCDVTDPFYVIGWMGLLLWSIGIPVVACSLLWKHRKELWKPYVKRRWFCAAQSSVGSGSVSLELACRYGFLTNGYDEGFWFWESVVTVRRVLIVIAASFFVGTRTNIRLLFMIIVATVALALQLTCQPFDNRNGQILNRLEDRALYSWTFTLILFAMIFIFNVGSWFNTLLVIIIVILQLSFLGLFAHHFYREMCNTVLNNPAWWDWPIPLRWVTRALKRSAEKFDARQARLTFLTESADVLLGEARTGTSSWVRQRRQTEANVFAARMKSPTREGAEMNESAKAGRNRESVASARQASFHRKYLSASGEGLGVQEEEPTSAAPGEEGKTEKGEEEESDANTSGGFAHRSHKVHTRQCTISLLQDSDEDDAPSGANKLKGRRASSVWESNPFLKFVRRRICCCCKRNGTSGKDEDAPPPLLKSDRRYFAHMVGEALTYALVALRLERLPGDYIEFILRFAFASRGGAETNDPERCPVVRKRKLGILRLKSFRGGMLDPVTETKEIDMRERLREVAEFADALLEEKLRRQQEIRRRREKELRRKRRGKKAKESTLIGKISGRALWLFGRGSQVASDPQAHLSLPTPKGTGLSPHKSNRSSLSPSAATAGEEGDGTEIDQNVGGEPEDSERAAIMRLLERRLETNRRVRHVVALFDQTVFEGGLTARDLYRGLMQIKQMDGEELHETYELFRKYKEAVIETQLKRLQSQVESLEEKVDFYENHFNNQMHRQRSGLSSHGSRDFNETGLVPDNEEGNNGTAGFLPHMWKDRERSEGLMREIGRLRHRVWELEGAIRDGTAESGWAMARSLSGPLLPGVAPQQKLDPLPDVEEGDKEADEGEFEDAEEEGVVYRVAERGDEDAEWDSLEKESRGSNIAKLARAASKDPQFLRMASGAAGGDKMLGGSKPRRASVLSGESDDPDFDQEGGEGDGGQHRRVTEFSNLPDLLNLTSRRQSRRGDEEEEEEEEEGTMHTGAPGTEFLFSEDGGSHRDGKKKSKKKDKKEKKEKKKKDKDTDKEGRSEVPSETPFGMAALLGFGGAGIPEDDEKVRGASAGRGKGEAQKPEAFPDTEPESAEEGRGKRKSRHSHAVPPSPERVQEIAGSDAGGGSSHLGPPGVVGGKSGKKGKRRGSTASQQEGLPPGIASVGGGAAGKEREAEEEEESPTASAERERARKKAEKRESRRRAEEERSGGTSLPPGVTVTGSETSSRPSNRRSSQLQAGGAAAGASLPPGVVANGSDSSRQRKSAAQLQAAAVLASHKSSKRDKGKEKPEEEEEEEANIHIRMSPTAKEPTPPPAALLAAPANARGGSSNASLAAERLKAAREKSSGAGGSNRREREGIFQDAISEASSVPTSKASGLPPGLAAAAAQSKERRASVSRSRDRKRGSASGVWTEAEDGTLPSLHERRLGQDEEEEEEEGDQKAQQARRKLVEAKKRAGRRNSVTKAEESPTGQQNAEAQEQEERMSAKATHAHSNLNKQTDEPAKGGGAREAAARARARRASQDSSTPFLAAPEPQSASASASGGAPTGGLPAGVSARGEGSASSRGGGGSDRGGRSPGRREGRGGGTQRQAPAIPENQPQLPEGEEAEDWGDA